jgi:hypothetical protein
MSPFKDVVVNNEFSKKIKNENTNNRRKKNI